MPQILPPPCAPKNSLRRTDIGGLQYEGGHGHPLSPHAIPTRAPSPEGSACFCEDFLPTSPGRGGERAPGGRPAPVIPLLSPPTTTASLTATICLVISGTDGSRASSPGHISSPTASRMPTSPSSPRDPGHTPRLYSCSLFPLPGSEHLPLFSVSRPCVVSVASTAICHMMYFTCLSHSAGAQAGRGQTLLSDCSQPDPQPWIHLAAQQQ